MSQHDDLFQELGRTLEVSPSPYFADGVRSRITRRRIVLRTTVSGLAIAASVVLVAVLREPAPVTVAAPMGVATAAEVAPPAPPSVAVVRALPRRVTPLAPAEPDRLMVVTNQMAILQAAWAGHQATVETEAPPDAPVPTPELMPIVVEPVRVLPVVIADSHTPVGGLPIIRRAVAALESK
jgi:hypothetical protein